MTAHRCPADDEAAIRNLIGLTTFLGDQGEPEDYRRVYVPDATWVMGDVTRQGVEEIVAAAAARRGGGTSGTRHLVTTLTIEVASDTARAVTYYLLLRDTSIIGTGTYRDELTRTEAGWRLVRREISAG